MSQAPLTPSPLGSEPSASPYLLIKALEEGVTITTIELRDGVKGTGMPERLDEGEVYVLRLDGRVHGYRIRGNAEVYSQFGVIEGTARATIEVPR